MSCLKPGAALRLALPRFLQKHSSSNSNFRSGTIALNSGGRGVLGARSRRSGLLSAFRVFLSPGATPVDSSTCLAEESSTIMANFSALTARPCCGSGL